MIFLKKKHVIPKQGGGGPPFGKSSHIFPFFFGDVPNLPCLEKVKKIIRFCGYLLPLEANYFCLALYLGGY